MSIRHFRIFIAVAEEENITKAAKKLYLTQPTVSVAIKEIEEHYGARFFERINQRLHITEEGKRFLDYAKHFIAMYDEMEIAFKNTDFTGRLRVGASVNIGTYYIPRLIREFRDRYPGINVQVKINTTAVVEKELLDGKLDLALVGGTIQSEHIVAEPLFYEKYTAICAPEHPMAGKTVPLEEFMKEPLLSREKSSGAYEVFQSAGKSDWTYRHSSMGKHIPDNTYGSGTLWIRGNDRSRTDDKKRSKRGAIIPDYLLRFLFPEYDSYSLSS